jgi:hypothetical protein
LTALTSFRNWITTNAAPRGVLVGLFAASIALMLAAAALDSFTPVPFLPTVLGSFAGLALFLAAYSACLLLLPADTLANLDPKARYPLAVRRPGVIAVGVVWLIGLMLFGRYLPEVLGGTLNVAAVAALFAVWSPTPTEAEAIAAAQAEAEAEAQVQADEQ